MSKSHAIKRNYSALTLEEAMQLIEKRRPVADFPEVYVESVERYLAGAW